MAYWDAGSVELASARSGRHWRRSPAARAFRLLLLLFVALQVADVATTNASLALAGHWEANPIMAASQTHLGAVWWLPKAVAAGFFCVMAALTRRCWPVIFAVAYYGLVVAVNFVQL